MHIIDPPMPSSERAALHLRAAAEYAGVCKSTLYKLAAAGRIKLIRIGGKTLVIRSSLDALLSERADAK
jgi:excisionase family DNA binding protein